MAQRLKSKFMELNYPAASNGVSKAFYFEQAIRSKLRGINPKGLNSPEDRYHL